MRLGETKGKEQDWREQDLKTFCHPNFCKRCWRVIVAVYSEACVQVLSQRLLEVGPFDVLVELSKKNNLRCYSYCCLLSSRLVFDSEKVYF